MRKRTSLAAASAAFAITAALSVATAGLAGATAAPQPATAASTAAMPAAPAHAVPAMVPAQHATIPAAPLTTPTPPVTNKPAAPAPRAPAGKVAPTGGIAPLLTPPLSGGTSGFTTCSGTAAIPTGSPGGPAAATGAGPCDTPVTFTVSSGFLSITVPVPVTPLTHIPLGTGAAGDVIVSGLGTGTNGAGAAGYVTVTDDRALATAGWTTTVSSTDFTNTTTSGLPVIPATDVYYFSGDVVGTPIANGTPAGPSNSPPAIPVVIAPGQPATGTGAVAPPTSGTTTGPSPTGATHGAAQLGGTAPTAMGLSAGVGANQVVWDPLIAVKIPTTAVSGDYTGTITHSVS